jgi:hypothetical protein
LQPHQRALHLLSALDHQTGYVLNQTQVDPTTNEAKAALELLKGNCSTACFIMTRMERHIHSNYQLLGN